LAELHAKGWVHGDVQPAHVIIGPERTHLIDLALARGGNVPEGYDFPFRGCLVHYEAPEIARSVLAAGEAEPTEEADIYALGASLLISATGWRAMEFAVNWASWSTRCSALYQRTAPPSTRWAKP
jgi:serine/threonine protein kinase